MGTTNPSKPAPAERFQRVQELRSAREAARLDRFLADSDPLLIAPRNDEPEICPVVSLRQWAGRRQVLPKSKFLVTCRPIPGPVPLKRSVDVLRAAMDWIEARLADGSMESTYLFPDCGGIAIMEADSRGALMRLLSGHPAYPFYTWDIQVLADWRTGLENVMRCFEILHGGPVET
jgi:muconolactone delta-isomerase